MSNPRGVVDISLLGETYRIKYTFEALDEFKSHVGISSLKELDEEKMAENDLLALIVAGIRGGDSEDRGAWTDDLKTWARDLAPIDVVDVLPKVMEAFNAAWGGESKAAPKKRPTRKTPKAEASQAQ